MTTCDFINKAKNVHGNKYDYSEVVYVNSTTPVRIICPVHGEFMQRPSGHLSGNGCRKCANEIISKKKSTTQADWIKEATEKHKGKFDYSKVVYVSGHHKVCIICPEHGEFWQLANNHLRGAGCPKCGKVATTAKQRLWTKERCFKEAKKYTSKIEFLKANPTCYRWCQNEGYFAEMDWFVAARQATGFWKSEEGHRKCIEIAHNYKTLRDFEAENEAVYNVARVYGYLKEMTWLKHAMNPAGYWTKDKCKAEALKYKTRSEFQKNSPAAHSRARIEGWLDEICSHMNVVGNRFKRCIYAFEFPNFNGKNYVYVGLTCNLNRRKKDHKTGRSSVKDFAEANGLEFPEPIIKTDYVEKDEARILEGVILGEYLDEGWIALNRAKTGALGGDNLLWNFDYIKDLIIREKVSGRRDLYKRFGGAYNSALEHDWLTKLFGDMPEKFHSKGYWNNREHVFKEARKYTRKIDFIHNAGAAYLKAKKNGWLEEMYWLYSAKVPSGYWQDKENVLAESRKHKTMSEFRDAPNKAYETAKANGWLEEMTWLELNPLDPGYFSKKRILAFARECKTRTEFHTKYGRAYHTAIKNGWLEEMTWFEQPKHRWTKERVFEIARKYSTRLDFKKKDGAVYIFAWRKGWLDEMTWLKPQKHGVWTKEEVFMEARNYSSRGDFCKGNASAYNAARNNNWLDEMTWFVSRRHENWKRESVFEESKKYKTKGEFKRHCSSGYAMARRNGWLEEMTWLKSEQIK